MSPDEIAVVVFSGVVALARWASWYVTPMKISRLGIRAASRRVMALAPIASAVVLFLVLRTLASFDVRDDARYLLFYMLLGAAWVGLVTTFLPLVGISARDDVIERGNPGAASAIAGAIVGATLCYAGGNVGDGPGWWVVVFAAALATAPWFALWLALDGVSGVGDAITIDRDRASGVRLAGFLIACGLILGRAVAGDWVSIIATVNDVLVVGSPTLVLLGLAALVERSSRPTLSRPQPGIAMFGMLPAVAYVVAAVAYVLALGPAA